MTRNSIRIIVCVVLGATGIACVISGIVLLHKKSVSSCEKENYDEEKPSTFQVTCNYSKEALRVGLPEFLQKVQDTFYDLHPEKIFEKPEVTEKEVWEKFQGYDPSPAKLKHITDTSFKLLAEIRAKKILKHQMKPRERKALAQVLHYLKHVFGTPYSGNYYAGDYLLGPGFFCLTMQPECHYNVRLGLSRLPPCSLQEVHLLLNAIRTLNHTFSQYRQNLIDGAKAGMVRFIDDCKKGVSDFLILYRGGRMYDAQGIFRPP